MILEQFEIGPMQNFIYIVADDLSRECLVVDPAWDVPFLLRLFQEKDFRLRGILITHGHHDHINGVAQLLNHFDVPVYVSRYETEFPFDFEENKVAVGDEEKIPLGSLEISCHHTPGHTAGCQCFAIENNLITGDTLFIDGCGHCRLKGNPEELYKTLYQRLHQFDDNTRIFPGHNYHSLKSDLWGNQKKTNPFLQFNNERDFIAFRTR